MGLWSSMNVRCFSGKDGKMWATGSYRFSQSVPMMGMTMASELCGDIKGLDIPFRADSQCRVLSRVAPLHVHFPLVCEQCISEVQPGQFVWDFRTACVEPIAQCRGRRRVRAEKSSSDGVRSAWLSLHEPRWGGPQWLSALHLGQCIEDKI